MSHHTILVFHGSPRKEANEKVLELVLRLNPSKNHLCSVAFLEFSQPDLPAALNSISDTENVSVTIVPVFLSEGRHVQRDIPGIIEKARSRNKGLRINIAPPFGSSECFERALSQFVSYAVKPPVEATND